MKWIPAFVILVAVEGYDFEHYCTEPKIFYKNHEEAQEQMKNLIDSKQFTETQLKIQKLWTQNKQVQ